MNSGVDITSSSPLESPASVSVEKPSVLADKREEPTVSSPEESASMSMVVIVIGAKGVILAGGFGEEDMLAGCKDEVSTFICL